MKKSRRLAYIPEDLLPQKLGRIESPLVANAPEELEPGEGGLIRAGIEEEGFDGHGLPVEGRAAADIRDRVDVAAAVEGSAGDIDPQLRDQLVGWGEVQGRDRHLPAAAFTPDNFPLQFVPPAEKPGGSTDRAELHEAADGRAADHRLTDFDGGNLDQLERGVPPAKRLRGALLLVSELEISADTERLGLEAFHQVPPYEGVGRQFREFERERGDENEIDACLFQQGQLPVQRRDHPRRPTGPQDPHRMRVESHHRRPHAERAGPRQHDLQNAPVAQVDAVEVPDAQDARIVQRGIAQIRNDFHRVMIIRMTGAKFERLVQIMATLRGPDGCPWDKQQDMNSLKPMLVEETYEVLEAIDNQDFDGLSEELGDVLLHIVFQARLAGEQKVFDIDTVIDKICDKLIRRHPHVFGSGKAGSPDEVIKNWEAIKAQEKAEKLQNRTPEQRSLLEGIPSKLPAIHEAHQISARAARAGFDWPDIEGVFEKLSEETQELREALEDPSDNRQARAEDEIGDILFVLVNLARFLKIDSESALKRANRKFKGRFQYMESQLAKAGKDIYQTPLADMEALWQEAKRRPQSAESLTVDDNGAS